MDLNDPTDTKGIKITLLIAASLTIMSAATIAPSLPQLALVFHSIPNAELLSKLVLTLPALFIAMTAPLAGNWIDKRGRLKLLFYGLVLYALAGTSGYYVNNIYLILAGRALLGIAVGIVMTVVTTLVGDYFEGEARQKFLGRQTAFTSLGGMLFVGTGGFLADINWRYPFLIYAFSFIVLFLAARFLKEPKVISSEKDSANEGIHKQLPIVFITAFILMVLFYMTPVQIPFHLKALGIEKNAMAGAAIAFNTLAAAGSSMLFNRLRRSLSFPILFAIGLSSLAIGFSLVWQASDFTLVAAGMLFSGIGMGQVLPGLSLWTLELTTPQTRGKYLGILTTCFFLGQFVSPLMVQPILVMTDMAGAFGIASAISLTVAIGFVVYHFVTKKTIE